LLIVRTELRFVPKVQVEILNRQAWSTRGIDKEVRQQQWQLVPFENPGFQVYALPPVANVAELVAEAERPGFSLVRVGVRRTNNNLEMQWRLPSRPTSAALSVFETAQRLALQV
jgi:hypothetical protein